MPFPDVSRICYDFTTVGMETISATAHSPLRFYLHPFLLHTYFATFSAFNGVFVKASGGDPFHVLIQ